MNHTVLRKWMAVLLAAVLCLGLLPAGAMAADEDFQVSKSKTADVDVLNRDDPVTEITLAMPSGEYQNKIDIVFVMDSSTSAGSGGVFSTAVRDLFNSILDDNRNVELKVGVIRFRGCAHDAVAFKSENEYSGLTVYDKASSKYIIDALEMTEQEIKDNFGSGSNAHGGIDIADEWLTDDTDVVDSNKYVVFLTDGKTYIWNNKDNEPTYIYLQQYGQTGATRWAIQNEGKPVVNQSASVYKHTYPVDVLDFSGKSNIFWFNDYQELYDCESTELSGESPWDAYCGYADNKNNIPTGSVIRREVTNGTALFGSNSATFGNKNDFQFYWDYNPSSEWEDVPYLEANPLKVITNGDGTYSFSTTDNGDGTFSITEDDINPNYYMYHVDGLMKSMYLTGHLWDEMNSKYNCAVITSSEGGATGFLELRRSFISWLQNNSDYGADVKGDSAVKALFKDIDNDIRYLVGSGVVTDQITAPFNLVMDGYGKNTPFKLVVGEKAYDAVVGETANTWTFGVIDSDGKFPYTVAWDSETNTFTWTINVPVENIKPLHLSYKLRWNDKGVPGEMTDTNASTKLVYWRSTTVTPNPDEPDGTEDFTSPQVLYPLQITYKANYEGGATDIIDKGSKSEFGHYKKDDSATLKAADTFTRPGYTFKTWNTAADGNGEDYAPGKEYNLKADTTFYAIWDRANSGGRPSGGGPKPPEIIPEEDVPLAPIPSVLNGDDHFAYVEGYPDGTVKPEGNVTRAETSTMLYRLLKPTWRDIYFTDQNSFSDVEKALWFNKAVSSMANGEYVNGYPDGTFQGNKHITRAEFVTIMVRFLEEDTTYDNLFSDIGSHWAKEYILKAVGAGWIDGYPDGTFRPNNEITRAEAMKIINSVLHRGVNETSELGQPQHLFPDNSDPGKWYYYEVIEATNDHEYEGERPDENWTRNAIDYFYDIVKYERPEA